ncbi:hypothetical protein [Halopseudomonas sp.]|uniref:hypothetical protein n=1 Tax=Halopseudomonas sp. TaxID=2901191 RepID=UPI00311E8539
MRKFMIVVSMASMIAGCASSRMPVLNQYEVDYLPWASAESVNAVSFERSGGSGNLAMCVAAVVGNSGETLTDSSNSFFGAYTGNYYRVEKSVQTGGGQVLEYVSPDNNAVVASGSERYQASSLVTRSVRFKLSAKQAGSLRQYRFSDLAQAQLDSGAAANTGYGPIGSWAGANPDLAVQALVRVTDEIESCLSAP